jgi:predicted RNA-binding Zn ribbon-like protein
MTRLEDLRRLGGTLCLDFVNTIDPRFGPARVDFIADYASLERWGVWSGAIAQAGAPVDRRNAEAVVRRAHALRDALYVLLSPRPATDDGPAALRVLNRELQRAGAHVAVRAAGVGFVPAWDAAASPDQVLWPVVRSAWELMLSPSLERVRECDGHDCGWLFLDTSKAGRRRWCSMEICGNRAKSRRYRRAHAA